MLLCSTFYLILDFRFDELRIGIRKMSSSVKECHRSSLEYLTCDFYRKFLLSHSPSDGQLEIFKN